MNGTRYNANRYKITSNKTENHILRLIHGFLFYLHDVQNHKLYYLYVNFVIYCHFHADKLAFRYAVYDKVHCVADAVSFGMQCKVRTQERARACYAKEHFCNEYAYIRISVCLFRSLTLAQQTIETTLIGKLRSLYSS